MADRGTAGDRLGRILYLLPLASRVGGVPLDEAAAVLGVDPATVQGDLAEVTARAFYHPAGGADELQISIEADRIKVFAGGKFARPPRLSSREALAVSLALRAVAAEAGPHRRAELLDLAHRIELELAVASEGEGEEGLAVDDDDLPGAELRGLLRSAVVGRRRARIRYLKPGGPEPSERLLDPYHVVYGRGGWYLIGYCHERKAVRVFRVDRVLGAELTEETFERPDSFEPADYIDGGRVFHSGGMDEVRVRYSPWLAPWIRERGPCEELPDGAVRVRFPGADPGWAVRHVLQYGAEAEIVEPHELREVVRETLESIARGA